ncbi:MAG: septum formation initiator family protein [Faecousia sp.]
MNPKKQPKPSLQVVVRSSSPALKIAVTVLIVFSMAALAALAWVRGSIRGQVESLRQEAAAIEQENRELQEKIDNLGSVQSVQDIAREELGLVDPNTVMIQPEQ